MNFKRLTFIHFICSLLIVLIALELGGSQQAVSAIAGALIVMVSVGFMAWSIGRMFAKKSVALAGMVIVIKYLLLGVTLYWLTLQTWVQLPWLAAGIASVVMTAVFYSLTTKDI